MKKLKEYRRNKKTKPYLHQTNEHSEQQIVINDFLDNVNRSHVNGKPKILSTTLEYESQFNRTF